MEDSRPKKRSRNDNGESLRINVGEIDFNALRETFHIGHKENLSHHQQQIQSQVLSPSRLPQQHPPDTPEQTLDPEEFFGFSLRDDMVFQSLSPYTWASVDNFSKVPLVFSTDDEFYEDNIQGGDIMSTSQMLDSPPQLHQHQHQHQHMQQNIPTTQNPFQQSHNAYTHNPQMQTQHHPTLMNQVHSAQISNNQRSSTQPQSPSYAPSQPFNNNHYPAQRQNHSTNNSHPSYTNGKSQSNGFTHQNWNYNENVINVDSQAEISQLRHRNAELEQKLNTVYELYLHQEQKLNMILEKLDAMNIQNR